MTAKIIRFPVERVRYPAAHKISRELSSQMVAESKELNEYVKKHADAMLQQLDKDIMASLLEEEGGIETSFPPEEAFIINPYSLGKDEA